VSIFHVSNTSNNDLDIVDVPVEPLFDDFQAFNDFQSMDMENRILVESK
jgi:hypothetical protein